MLHLFLYATVKGFWEKKRWGYGYWLIGVAFKRLMRGRDSLPPPLLPSRDWVSEEILYRKTFFVISRMWDFILCWKARLHTIDSEVGSDSSEDQLLTTVTVEKMGIPARVSCLLATPVWLVFSTSPVSVPHFPKYGWTVKNSTCTQKSTIPIFLQTILFPFQLRSCSKYKLEIVPWITELKVSPEQAGGGVGLGEIRQIYLLAFRQNVPTIPLNRNLGKGQQ